VLSWNGIPKSIEQKHGIWLGNSKVPAQRMIDFTQVKLQIYLKLPMFLERLQLKWDKFFPFLTQILREGFLNLGNPCVGI
jgi:hypothetical protein